VAIVVEAAETKKREEMSERDDSPIQTPRRIALPNGTRQHEPSIDVQVFQAARGCVQFLDSLIADVEDAHGQALTPDVALILERAREVRAKARLLVVECIAHRRNEILGDLLHQENQVKKGAKIIRDDEGIDAPEAS
jgi:hypothetical protein